MFQYINIFRLLDYDIVACSSPFSRRMIDTFPEEFICSHPAKPSITWRKISNTQYLVDCSRYYYIFILPCVKALRFAKDQVLDFVCVSLYVSINTF